MSAIHPRAAKRAVLPWAACAAAAALVALAAPPAAAQATRIVIDPDTKRARAPEHDEIAAAKAAAANARAMGAPRSRAETLLHGQPINAQLGARGHRVDAKRMSFSVVKRQPDGSWSTQCVNGESAAQHALHSNAPVGGGHDR